jgi:hypothetical protein
MTWNARRSNSFSPMKVSPPPLLDRSPMSRAFVKEQDVDAVEESSRAAGFRTSE